MAKSMPMGASRLSSLLRSWRCLIAVAIIFGSSLTNAGFVEFRDCLDDNIINSNPQLLQFVPLSVNAVFNSSGNQNLNLTIYGNVTGKATNQTYPPSDDPSWTNPNITFGKIPNVSLATNTYTTLFTEFDVLSYTPYHGGASEFCSAVTQGGCPLAPAFNVTSTDLEHLRAFSVAHDMFSSYAFTSIIATMRIQTGDATKAYYGCIKATITPALGASLEALLRYLPLVILILVGVATIAAAIFSPWGSSDIFNWSSNFGRDEDLLRLVTPGFADCLQYLQFIVFTGSLSLNYPGFYQPVVSRVAWSALMFNESFVTGGNGTQSVVNGVYQLRDHTADGLDRMSQYVGMTSPKDLWADMIVWLVAIVAGVSILTQLAFALRWVYRQIAHVPAEDLRSKNGPFTLGNAVRAAFSYFLLPMLVLSFYQLVIASKGPTYSVALAAIVIVLVVAFSTRLLWLFVRTRPKSFLYDDLLTLLAYGPLYNTYCDDAAVFALIPIGINFLRGIAIGAVQQSGVAQVVLLALCEIVILLTINTFRPYPSATSMNLYHTLFSIIRLITIFLSITFVPSLGVDDSSRGWIGYVILLIHACVLIFGFFLNAVQTLIEVVARIAGAGGRDGATGGAARGGLVKVFGMRQLSRRVPRPVHDSRHSMASSAAMLQASEKDHKDVPMAKTRSRSLSASSTMLLENSNRNTARFSQNLDTMGAGQITPDSSSTFSRPLMNRMSSASGGAIVGLQSPTEAKDPYYRPPRRNTMDLLSTTQKHPRPAFASGDWSKKASVVHDDSALEDDNGEGASTPVRGERDELEDVSNELYKTKTDYAVREVDFYYGVRGPALSSGTRKLKTGPADPTGPVSSATGWFKGLIGGKSKEKNKGFEVVRSSRAIPPGMLPPSSPEPEIQADPYRDDLLSPKASRHTKSPPPRVNRYEEMAIEDDVDDERPTRAIVPTFPPSLPLIDTTGAIELPSRIGSQTNLPQDMLNEPLQAPAIPRKSSRRESGESFVKNGRRRFSSLVGTSHEHRNSNATNGSGRIPFASSTGPDNTGRNSIGAESMLDDFSHGGDGMNLPSRQPFVTHLARSGSALGTHADADRPSSVGFVQHHRASDNIYHSPDSADLEGSTAEVLGKIPSRH